MAEIEHTEAEKFLKYFANKTEIDQSAVNKLLALGHHRPQQESHSDPLVREMLKGAQQ